MLALTLAGVGIYGVMSYSVSQQTREIGIRMALGASTADVTRAVLRPSLWITGIGLTLGLGTALLASRLMSSLLFGINAGDPITFVGVALVLGAIALLASAIPARRAARLDPKISLRD